MKPDTESSASARGYVHAFNGAKADLEVCPVMGESAMQYQLRLSIGHESFTICKSRVSEDDAHELRRTFSRALGRLIDAARTTGQGESE